MPRREKQDLHRTLVHLRPEQHEQLRDLAYQHRTTIADLIRRAVDHTYGIPDTQKAA